MLVFERIDTRLFKAFLAAAQAENFTLAAEKAGMTQSGISQHIAKLEEQVGVPLFERINKKVILTDAGKDLRHFIESYSDTLDSFIDRVAQKNSEPQGPVSYAMPASCLKTPHFPLLLEKRSHFPKVDIKVHIAANNEIFDRLVSKEIDFGFVTQKSENPALQYKLFAQEQYILVGKDKSLVRGIDSKNLTEIPFILYPGMDTLLEFWRQAHFPQKKTFNVHSALVRGEINDLDGAITMVRHGLGCGIFPKHCVEEFLQTKEIFAFEGKKDPVGDIWVATRKNFILPTRVEHVIQAFWEMKSKG